MKEEIMNLFEEMNKNASSSSIQETLIEMIWRSLRIESVTIKETVSYIIKYK